jgi:hypothetical protein
LNDWCSTKNLLKDTLLFNNPSNDVFIDEKYCESWMDWTICLKGRIQNSESLKKNIEFLNIDNIDSLNNEVKIGLGAVAGAQEWFDFDQLEENKTFYKYYKFLGKNTHKWIYISDGEVCDTFYIAVVNT